MMDFVLMDRQNDIGMRFWRAMIGIAGSPEGILSLRVMGGAVLVPVFLGRSGLVCLSGLCV